MITIKTIRLLHLFSYLFVASQVLFYLFILSDALKQISLNSFFEQRKVIDSLMIGRFKLMYYSCLVLSVLVVAVSVKDTASLFFISSSIALVFLGVDLCITVNGSLPLNSIAHTYGAESDAIDWETVRTQWLDYMKYRGISIAIGMLVLLTGLVFEKN